MDLTKPRSWLVLAAIVVGAYSLLLLPSGSVLKPGTQLTGIKAELADGTVFDLDAHRGEVIVLSFWASWCGPCRREAPVLSRLSDRGVHVIGLGVEEHSVERLARDARDLGARYMVGKPGPGVLDKLRVSVIPTTYVIDGKGAVVLSRTGVVSEDDLEQAIRDAS